MGLKRNMDENGLEQSIITYLKDKAGYEDLLVDCVLAVKK